jgi:6-phosphogluconolactonase/glucosamine-6-phosphate isomerase/deaminase
MITTRQCPNPEQVIQQAAIYLNTLFYSLKGKPFLFLSSGGSALKVLQFINTGNLTESATVAMLDERFSDDVTINNFAQMMALPFYTGAQASGVQFMDTRKQPNDTLASAADRWNKQLHQWAYDHQDGQIIATLGMGPDGHISGVMPYPEAGAIFDSLFCQPEPWVVGYQATGKNPFPDRVTTTMTFLKEKVNNAVAVISGADKKEALLKVTSADGSLPKTPARIMREMKNVLLYTDIV